MILVRLSNGDTADTDTPEEAVFAATTILREAQEAGNLYTSTTASFYGADGILVRERVTLADLTVGGTR